MSDRLDSVTQSYAFQASEYRTRADPSATGSLQPGVDIDGDDRASSYKGNGFGGSYWWLETQGSATNPFTANMVAELGIGVAGRYFVAMRVASGTGHVGVWRDGVQVGTTVDATNTEWALIDTGANLVHDLGSTVHLRAWGSADVHVGVLYFIQRCVGYSLADYATGIANVTTDAGSISTNVIQINNPADSRGIYASLTPGALGVISPLMTGRYTETAIDTTTFGDFADHLGLGGGATKNNVQMPDYAGYYGDPPGTLYYSDLVIHRGYKVCMLTNNNYDPPWVSSGPPQYDSSSAVSFAGGDVLDIFMAPDRDSGAPTAPGFIDRLLIARPCVPAYFDALNGAKAGTFEYSWTPDGSNDDQLDHYDIVVTDAAETILITYANVTSPFTVGPLPAGEVHVYLFPTTADGDYSCWDRDIFTVSGFRPQIVRYR